MLQKTLLFCSFFLISALAAQDLGVALNFASGSSTIDRRFQEEFLKQIKAQNNDEFIVYDWDRDARKLTFLEEAGISEEKPASLAVFVEQYTSSLDLGKINLSIKTDTNNIVTGASYLVTFNASYRIKVIDVKTGRIEAIPDKIVVEADRDPTKKVDAVIQVDITKYFSKTKPYLSSSQWRANKKHQELMKRIKNDYRTVITERYNSLAGRYLVSLGEVAKRLNGFGDKKVYTLEVADIDAAKIKIVTVNIAEEDHIKSGYTFDIYTIKEINGLDYPIYLSSVYVDEINGQKAICKKMPLLSAKKFAESLRVGKERGFYLARSSIGVNNIVTYPPEKKINVSLGNNACMMCGFEIEEEMGRMVAINLIERAAPELDQLRTLYKDARFIDYDLGAYQDQQIGVDYLFSIEGSTFNVTNIATGQQISVDRKKGEKKLFKRGLTVSQAWKKALLNISEKEITLHQVLKQKKNKIKSIKIFHPFEVGMGENYDISVIEIEEVAGKKIDRKVFIAKGRAVPTIETRHFGILKIDEGKAALYKAINAEKKLVFTYSIERN